MTSDIDLRSEFSDFFHALSDGVSPVPSIMHPEVTIARDLSRREACLYKVNFGSRTFFLKTHSRESAGRAHRISREYNAYTWLSDHCDETLFVCGDIAGSRKWILLEWSDGPSLGRFARNTATAYTAFNERYLFFRPVLRSMFQRLSNLHQVGALHGDVNPNNLIVNHDRTWLIDYEQAQIPGYTSEYSGGLLHFASPNVAIGMRDGSRRIVYSKTDELHAYVATVFTVVTLQTLYVTNKEQPWSENLERIIKCNVNRRVADFNINTAWERIFSKIANMQTEALDPSEIEHALEV